MYKVCCAIVYCSRLNFIVESCNFLPVFQFCVETVMRFTKNPMCLQKAGMFSVNPVADCLIWLAVLFLPNDVLCEYPQSFFFFFSLSLSCLCDLPILSPHDCILHLLSPGAVFAGYYHNNPPGVYFSMPVLLSLLWALLKAGMVSDVFSVLSISLAHKIVVRVAVINLLIISHPAVYLVVQ